MHYKIGSSKNLIDNNNININNKKNRVIYFVLDRWKTHANDHCFWNRFCYKKNVKVFVYKDIII